MLKHLTVATLALAIAACGPDEDDALTDTGFGAAQPDLRGSTAAGAADVGSWSAANVIAHIATGDSLEVELAQMAQERAQSEDVKQIAQTIERDHSANRDRAMELSQQQQMQLAPPPGDTTAMHFRNVTQRLEGMEGAQFDSAWIEMQIQHHQSELQSLTTMESTAQDSQVRQFVQNTRETVQQHLDRLQQISQGGGTDTARSNQ